MTATPIEWTDFSINPLRAKLQHVRDGKILSGDGHYCEKIGKDCKECYSSRTQPRFRMPPFQEQRRAGVEHYLDVRKLQQVLARKKPTKYFWCDMTDMFGHWVPNEWIAACFGVMAATPWHTHQVLTKRADRLPEWFAWISSSPVSLGGSANAARGVRWHAWNHLDELKPYDPSQPWVWPLPNVWLGVSAGYQEAADERLPYLLRAPAAVRFVSAEPLIGPVDLRAYLARLSCRCCPRCGFRSNIEDGDTCPNDGGKLGPDVALDWVIVGGESGQKARACAVDWVRSIVTQCADAEVPCFVKQLGADPRLVDVDDAAAVEVFPRLRLRARKGNNPQEWPADICVREFPR